MKYLLLCLLILLSVSCYEEVSINEEIIVEPEVEHARKWFLGNYNEISSANSANERREIWKKDVKWNRGNSYIKGGKTTIEVDLEYDLDIVATTSASSEIEGFKNLTKLIMIKDEKGDYDVYIMRMIPSEGSLATLNENSYKQKTENFSGEIIYYDWNESPVLYVRYKDGNRVGRLFSKNNAYNPNARTSEFICGFVTIHWYQRVCSPSGCTETYLGADTYYICEHYSQDQYFDPADGDLGEGGSVGNIVPNLDDEVLIELWENEKINDLSLDPCMKSIVANLKNLSNRSIGKIIKKFSGSNPGYNWKMENSNLGATVNANTSQQYDRGTGTVTTKFDANKFMNATDLSIARTILHESVHAYLVVFFKLEPIMAVSEYSELVQDFLVTQDANIAHHNEMTRNFVNEIAYSLQEFGALKGYNFSLQFYKDLAWGGLTNTPAFQSFSIAEQNRINNVILVEQTGLDLQGITQAQNGSNAGC